MRSFNYARKGMGHVLATQRNIWIHFGIGVLVLLAAISLKMTPLELALIVLTVTVVIAAEMFNTALEALVDLVKPEDHPLAALVKNVAAGAVLALALGAIFIGLLLFIPRVA
ncbi:MAG: diacylglycerol kinase family protein [Candidatus Margulisbacteria bacterium]|jgi:diacylglycerol kinase (ATP)|nr:diacylglycerol kinase family protein [Candidatus Margulisiibacteriota bacterium]